MISATVNYQQEMRTNKKKVNLIGWGNDTRWDRDEGREEEKKKKKLSHFIFEMLLFY